MTTENETHLEEFEGEDELEQGGESVEDTIARSIEELTSGDAETDESLQGDEGQDTEAAKVSASEAARVLAAQKKPKKQVIEAKDLQLEKGVKKGREQKPHVHTPEVVEKLDPPVGWDVKDKEEFAKLPEPAKRQSLAFWGRMNKVFTQGTQELSRYRQKYGELEEVENFYKPHLDALGLNYAQTSKELLATHVKLATDTDAELLRLIAKNGRSLESLYNFREGRGGNQQFQPQQPQPQHQHPQNAVLTPEEVDRRVEAKFQQYQHGQVVQSEAQELDSVRNEVGPDGRYLYPELWDSENMQGYYWNQATIDRVKPLYDSLRKTQPELSFAETLKRAIFAHRQMNGQAPSSPAPLAQRLPQTTSNSEIARARAANVSIRSRGNHSISTSTGSPAGETVEQSIAKAIAELGGDSRY